VVLCTRVTSGITLLDPVTLRTATMDAPVYWRTPFKAMLTSRALVEYIVLDIEPLHGAGGGGSGYGSSSSGSSGKWSLADAQVARKSDFGRNDTVFFARTHLGHILHPGKADSLLGLNPVHYECLFGLYVWVNSNSKLVCCSSYKRTCA
jgi:nonsense-mediated mRNA decay protein 3